MRGAIASFYGVVGYGQIVSGASILGGNDARCVIGILGGGEKNPFQRGEIL